jgi:hypothetical protein
VDKLLPRASKSGTECQSSSGSDRSGRVSLERPSTWYSADYHECVSENLQTIRKKCEISNHHVEHPWPHTIEV